MLPDRFMDKVLPEPISGCWLWTGAIKSNGYAVIGIGGKILHAHRVAYEAERGGIPDGLSIDHLCRVRSCVNPHHLEAVTQGENVRRGQSGAVNAARIKAKTHCPRGHAYSGYNLTINPNGSRSCKACNCLAVKRYRERQAECQK